MNNFTNSNDTISAHVKNSAIDIAHDSPKDTVDRMANTKIEGSQISWQSFLQRESLAGLAGGASSTLICHPLEVVKTRLQVERAAPAAKSGSIVRLVSSIWQQEGILHGFYRGCALNTLGGAISWACYFSIYEQAKTQVANIRSAHALSSLEIGCCSFFAGISTALLTNPIWVIKTRVLAQPGTEVSSYRGFLDGFGRLVRSEGILGLYKGIIPSLLFITQGAFHLIVYEKLKSLHRKRLQDRQQHERRQSAIGNDVFLGTEFYLAYSAISKIVSGTFFYPLQVVRARLQVDRRRSSQRMVDVARKIARLDGAPGFYRGLLPYLCRIVPHSCITFAVYEAARAA